MKTNERLEFVKQVGGEQAGGEIITEEELINLLDEKKNPIAYDGFEPSGTDIHIAQGLLRAININKMIKAGFRFKILIADWHAWANNKMGGNLEHIQKVGKYLIEVWKSCDMELDNVDFIWASELVKDDSYWKKVMGIARHSTVKRVVRCSQIIGRSEKDTLQASQILYPCMQAADIFHLNADVVQLGMDQRKVNVLAREIGPKLGYYKPIAVHHHMLMGLGQPPKQGLTGTERGIELKMSKSRPDTAIFMTDSREELNKKIKKAYCPEGVIEENPILEYCRHIIFEKFDNLKIKRPEKWGGDLEFNSYPELESSFVKKELHPMDLKAATVEYLDKLLDPIRKKLDKNKRAQELLKEISRFKVTR
ncbi:tyrosine--tRNA ligase [Candidatus Woesearchaeota archaeon]|nr:tyrosine--tRNA ligase [Candidatus Woesearchaeota archaeon]